MNYFEQILKDGNKESLNTLYKNVKTMTKVQRKKSDYVHNLTNILTLFDHIQKPTQTLDYGKMGGYFTMKDFKEIFGNFRQTLMHGRSQKAKRKNLLDLGSKVNALRRYYHEFE